MGPLFFPHTRFRDVYKTRENAANMGGPRAVHSPGLGVYGLGFRDV